MQFSPFSDSDSFYWENMNTPIFFWIINHPSFNLSCKMLILLNLQEAWFGYSALQYIFGWIYCITVRCRWRLERLPQTSLKVSQFWRHWHWFQMPNVRTHVKFTVYFFSAISTTEVVDGTIWIDSCILRVLWQTTVEKSISWYLQNECWQH